MSYHIVIAVGNLGRDPEMRYTPSGQAVTNFSVATSRKYTGSDGNLVEETTWFRVSVWGKQAETCNQYLKKGSRVLVEGRLIPDLKTGSPKVYSKQDGTSGASFELHADTVRFLSSGNGGQHESSSETASGSAGDETDDIPF